MKRVFQLLALFLFTASIFTNIYAQLNVPSNLVVEKSYSRYSVGVKLQWNNSNQNMEMRDHVFFNIYRKDGAQSDSGSFRKIYSRVEGTSWFDYQVHLGATYSYFVTAVNFQGESNPSDTVQISLDSTLTQAVLTGKITGSVGNAIAEIQNANVLLVPVFGWGAQEQRTDSSGNYKFQVYPGTYLLYVSARGYYPEYYNDVRNIFNATKIVVQSSDSVNIDMQLHPVVAPVKYQLSGTVTDSLGNPIKAFIEVYRLVHNSFSFRNFDDSHREYDAVTDSSGKYTVSVDAGDTVVVFAHAISRDYLGQYYNSKTSFLDADRIGISGDTSGIDFILQHKPVYKNEISGTVMNSDSESVNSIIFAIRTSGNMNGPNKYNTVTDSTGSYSLTNLVPGNYILLCLPQGDYIPTFFKYDGTQTLHWKDADSVAVDSTSITTGINFTVMDEPDSGAATVTGNVSDNNGNPLQGAFVFATDQNQSTYSFGVTDQNGNFTICGLIPGSYTVSSDLYGYTSGQSTTASVDYSTSFNSTASFSLTPETVTSVVTAPLVLKNYSLSQNYPNPFNPSTTISYSVPSSEKVVLKVFNILGRVVATLVNSQVSAGMHNMVFNASNLASGVYFYQIQAGNFVATKKLILLK